MWTTSAPRQGPVVLLVEDDDDLRNMTTDPGAARIPGAGGQRRGRRETTCRVHQGTIDLLLTDLGLPGVSGGELPRSAAAIGGEMEIVYVSGVPKDIAIKKG